MTIGYRAASSTVVGTTNTLVVSAPAGLAATDISFLTIAIKPYSMTVFSVTNPGGWNKIIDATNGTTASGVDTGSTRLVVFMRVGPTYTNTTITFSGAPAIAQANITAYTRASNEAWLVPKVTTGFDATNGANYSATGNAVIGTTSGNRLLTMTAINSDAGPPATITLTETGATLSDFQVRINDGTATGDDSGVIVADAACSAGTGTNAPTLTYQDGASTSGTTGWVRLTVAATNISVAKVDPFDDYGGYTLNLAGLNSYDQWQLTRVSSFSDVYPEEFVRGGELQDTTLSSTVLTDYEFHFSDVDSITEESLIYHLKLYFNGVIQDDVTTAAQNPVLHRSQSTGFSSYESPVTFIKDIFNSTTSITAVVENFNAFQKSGRILAEHQVLRKKNPIVISDVASGMRGSFTLLVVGVSGGFSGGGVNAIYNKQIDDLFSSGSTYYFQSIFPYVVGVSDFYFRISDYSFSRQNRIARQTVARASDLPANIHPLSVWEISFIEVDRPSDLDIASIVTTWGNNGITGGTWQEVKNNNVNWFDVLDVH